MTETRSRYRDWMTMSPSDWMNMAPSDWINMATQPDWISSAWWNKSYSELMNTKPSEWLAMMYGAGTAAGTGPSWKYRERRYRPSRECCRRCGADPCQCACCIGDVDFAVYSRVGEQRVIPIIVENERRREKQVTVELSGWTTRGGKPAPIETVLLEPKTFTLAACAEQKITLVVRVRETEATREAANQTPEQRVPPDVDNCVVATADLRLTGCDHRPIRIAVAILPRDCDPYQVSCGCTCC
jgi:hypothetical protein